MTRSFALLRSAILSEIEDNNKLVFARKILQDVKSVNEIIRIETIVLVPLLVFMRVVIEAILAVCALHIGPS